MKKSLLLFLPLILFISCEVDVTTTVNEIEPNNTTSTAQSVSADGTVYRGTVSPAGDYDGFKLYGEAGRVYTFRVLWESGSSFNVYCQVYTDTGLIGYVNENGAASNETVVLSVTGSGNFYLVISDYLDSYTGGYTFTVTDQSQSYSGVDSESESDSGSGTVENGNLPGKPSQFE